MEAYAKRLFVRIHLCMVSPFHVHTHTHTRVHSFISSVREQQLHTIKHSAQTFQHVVNVMHFDANVEWNFDGGASEWHTKLNGHKVNREVFTCVSHGARIAYTWYVHSDCRWGWLCALPGTLFDDQLKEPMENIIERILLKLDAVNEIQIEWNFNQFSEWISLARNVDSLHVTSVTVQWTVLRGITRSIMSNEHFVGLVLAK